MTDETERSRLNLAALAPDKKLHPLEARERFAVAWNRFPLYSFLYAARDVNAGPWTQEAQIISELGMTIHASCRAVIDVQAGRVDSGLEEALLKSAGSGSSQSQEPDFWAKSLDALVGVAVDWGDIYTVNHILQLCAQAPSDLPYAVRRRLQQRVTTERCYFAIRHRDSERDAGEWLQEFRRTYLRPRGDVIDAGNLGDWDEALFETLIEERWRESKIDKPHAYLQRACNRQIQGRDTDKLKRIAARDDDAWLPSSEPVTEYRIEDVEAIFSLPGFDDEIKAYLRGRLKGATRATMASYLREATGEPWDDKRVERVRKRLERMRPGLAALYRGRSAGGPGDWDFASGGEADTDLHEAPGLSDVLSVFKPVPDYGPGDLRHRRTPGPHAVTSAASIAHSKQRIWITEPGGGQGFVFAHKWDRGNGVMDTELAEAFREILQTERSGLFRAEDRGRCPICGRATCGVKLSALPLLPGMAERRAAARWAVQYERIVSSGKKANSLKIRKK